MTTLVWKMQGGNEMHIIGLTGVRTNFEYQWPKEKETFGQVVEYETRAKDGRHSVWVGFCRRPVYGKDRVRVVIWINGQPHAEFLGADDFDRSGEVLSEIKIPGHRGERICRYPNEPIPERYNMFNVVGLPVRVRAKGVHKAWAVVANIADHKTMIMLAALRRLERSR